MAVPTLTLLNHTLLADANTVTNWTLLTTLDTDIKVEGANSVSGIFRADLASGYYTAASAPITAAGKTFRGWILTNNLPYMEPVANGGYELQVYDGTTTEYKTMFGSDTYGGGWFNVVWDMDTFTAVTLANVRRWGYRAQHSIAAKNAINTWADVMRYLDGYSMTGGTSGDKVRLMDIATIDKTNAYGVLSNYEGVYFSTGAIQFGTGATAHHFEMDGDVLVFIEKPVKAGLYKVVGVGSGTNVVITGSVLRSTGTTDATRFVIDFDDSTLASLVFTGNLIVRASTSAFKTGQSITDNIFDNCGQITHGGSDMRGSSVSGYEGTANTSALLYNVNADPAGEMDNMSFTKGTAATHAIEFGTTSPTTLTLNGLSFAGYNASNNQNDSALHIKRTSGTVTINLNSVSGTVSYRTDGATVSLVNSTTLTLTGLKNPTEVRVFNAGTTTAIAGQEDVTTGTFSTGIDAATYPSVDIAIISLGYQNIRLLSIATTSSISIPIQQTIDRQYAT
jgi:hypothetical protein